MDENQSNDVFDFFKECVTNSTSDEWNKYRRKYRKQKITMEGLDFTGWSLQGFILKGICFHRCNFSQAVFKNCTFDQCQMDELEAFGTEFYECSVVSASIKNSNLVTCRFFDSDFRYVVFSESTIHQSFINRSNCNDTLFNKVSLFDTCLSQSTFSYSDFRGAEVRNVQMHGSDFTGTVVDGDTIFWDCYYDKKTNFTGVGLASCRIEPALLSSFQCNIRRNWWNNWYKLRLEKSKLYYSQLKKNPLYFFPLLLSIIGAGITTFFVKLFWWITDYGSSTIRLIFFFLASTVCFALIYFTLPFLTNDAVLNTSPDILLKLIRSLYFSVVIMTGLGFGDIHASDSSYVGHIVILSESLIGYILLGAFLVRIGILFQGEFPVASTRTKVDNLHCSGEKSKDNQEEISCQK